MIKAKPVALRIASLYSEPVELFARNDRREVFIFLVFGVLDLFGV
jgi:hypothetical protein